MHANSQNANPCNGAILRQSSATHGKSKVPDFEKVGTMNYSNTSVRLTSSPRSQKFPADTVLSVEVDKRGTHLRLRKTATVVRRARHLAVAASILLGSAVASYSTVTVYEPDAWTRTNSATTSYFGWDVLESSGIPLGYGTVLNDSTPDVGVSVGIGIDGLSARIYQGTGVDGGYGTYGHRSGSGNYYSGFNEGVDFADDTITAISRGGSGGYTTVVLQVLGQAENANLAFAISGGDFTLQKSLYGISGGVGIYWYEWTAPGANIPFAIDMNSDYASVAVDSFTIDTYWTSGSEAVVNSIESVPEPTSAALGGLGLLLLLQRRRKLAASA